MQQQSYYSTGGAHGSFSYGTNSQVLTDGSSDTDPNNDIYDPTNDATDTTHPYYYGLFDNTQYYTYDYTNGLFVTIGSTSASGTANVGVATVWSGSGAKPASGLSGAVLNWALTSRIDAELKALIGGASFDARDVNANGRLSGVVTGCDSNSPGCFLKAQGARRYLSESTNVNAQFYIRPATWTSAVSGTDVDYPEDWSTP